MIRSEIRKLFQRLSTRIILLVLLAANAFLVWNQPLPGAEQYYQFDASHILSLYSALPDDAASALKALEQQDDALVEAMILETDAGSLLTSDVYTEHKLFSNILERVEPVARYDTILTDIDENAQTLLLTGRYEPDTFGYRNILKSQEQYRELSDVQPEVLYSGAVELLPGARISDLILLLFCLLVGLELIGAEKTNGTLQLIKPTFQGGNHLITAKVLAGLVLALAGTLLLYGTNLVIGFLRCGMISMDAPIQSVFGFVRSPWRISISIYILGFFAMKYLWAASVAAIVYLACSLGKSVLGSCGIFLILCAPLSLPLTGDTVGLFSEYRNLDLFCWPVSSFFVSILGMLLVSSAGFILTAAIHIKNSPIIADRRSKNTGKVGRVSVNLISYEARKLFLMNGAVWVLAGLMGVQIVTYLNFNAYLSPQERLYLAYSEKLEGKADPEKDAFIEEEAARFADLYAQMEEYAYAYSNGELQQEAFEAISSRIARQLESEEVFLRAKDQYDRMKAQGYDYVCQTGYERLLGPEGQEDALILSIQLMIALILGLASIHAGETETNMVFLLNSAPGHQRSRRVKGILATVYAVTAAVITFAPHITAIAKNYGLSGLFACGHSVPLLRMGTQTVLTGLCIYAAIAIGLAILMAHLVSLISQKSGSIASTVVMSSTLLLFPAALYLIL